MKALLDFIPLAIFFVLYKTSGIFVATGALIITTVIQVALTYYLTKKVEKAQIITVLAVVILGSLTIIFKNPEFIIWKVSVIYALFAIGLAGSGFLGKPLVKTVLSKEINIADKYWYHVNTAWALFFSFLAVLNIYVAKNYSMDIWVNFKVFGVLVAMFVFIVFTVIYLIQKEKTTNPASYNAKIDGGVDTQINGLKNELKTNSQSTEAIQKSTAQNSDNQNSDNQDVSDRMSSNKMKSRS